LSRDKLHFGRRQSSVRPRSCGWVRFAHRDPLPGRAPTSLDGLRVVAAQLEVGTKIRVRWAPPVLLGAVHCDRGRRRITPVSIRGRRVAVGPVQSGARERGRGCAGNVGSCEWPRRHLTVQPWPAAIAGCGRNGKEARVHFLSPSRKSSSPT
jgi:hypothetical protein